MAKKITGMMKRIHARTDTTRLAVNAKGEMVTYHDGLIPLSDKTCTKVGKTLDSDGLKGLSILEGSVDGTIVELGKNGAQLSNEKMRACAIKNAPYTMTYGIKKIGVKNPVAINLRMKTRLRHSELEVNSKTT